MLGKQIAEGRGKRTGRRVIATDPHLLIEATAEETTTLLGIEGMNIITYKACIKPDGSLHGEGEGAFATLDGQIVTWKGLGVGRFGDRGSVHYAGTISYTTTSQKLTRLNGLAGAFEFDIDADGNTQSKIWEMVPAGATRGAGA